MSEMKRFWISPKLYSPANPVEAEYYIAYDQPGDPKRLEIEVIEYSAYQRLERALEIAMKGLLNLKLYSKFDDDRYFFNKSSEALAEIEAILKGEG